MTPRLPAVTLPAVTLPAVTLPAVTLPAVTLPAVTLPAGAGVGVSPGTATRPMAPVSCVG